MLRGRWRRGERCVWRQASGGLRGDGTRRTRSEGGRCLQGKPGSGRWTTCRDLRDAPGDRPAAMTWVNAFSRNARDSEPLSADLRQCRGELTQYMWGRRKLLESVLALRHGIPRESAGDGRGWKCMWSCQPQQCRRSRCWRCIRPRSILGSDRSSLSRLAPPPVDEATPRPRAS